jgi:hypothetical protein
LFFSCCGSAAALFKHAATRQPRRKPTVETFIDNTAKLRQQTAVLALRAAGANQLLKPASTTLRSYGRRHRSWHHGHVHAMHNMQRTTSGAAGNGLYTTFKYMRGASGIGMGTTIKHLRRTTSGAAGNGLGATMKYQRRTTSATANNCMSTTITPPCSAASVEVNSELHTGARISVRLCVGPELARGVHIAINRNLKAGT